MPVDHGRSITNFQRWKVEGRNEDCKNGNGWVAGTNPLLTFFCALWLICGCEDGLTGRKEAIGNEGRPAKIKEEINSFFPCDLHAIFNSTGRCSFDVSCRSCLD